MVKLTAAAAAAAAAAVAQIKVSQLDVHWRVSDLIESGSAEEALSSSSSRCLLLDVLKSLSLGYGQRQSSDAALNLVVTLGFAIQSSLILPQGLCRSRT